MFDSNEQARIDTLFAQAIGLPAQERAAFLDRECKSNESDLRSEVERLLSHDERIEKEDRFLGEPPMQRVANEIKAVAHGAGTSSSEVQQVNADRNLLVAILALQMDFISRDQMVDGMQSWIVDKRRPIEDILSEKGFLDDETKLLLVALVSKHLQQHENNPEQSLKSLSSLGGLRDDLRGLDDGDVERSLAFAGARASDPHGEHDVTRTLSDVSPRGDRYTILRPHAKGGLGQVSVAIDRELSREVALKEIQEPFATNEDCRSRFVLEAEVTGGLEHPGIVPVYGLGTYADGRPYYAMRFIKGDSLKTATDNFHSQNKRVSSLSYQSIEFRSLLNRFTDVCNAIEYAHSRGVLHRDLKPGNIMLGKYGETLVVDWGLAKLVGREEATPKPDEASLRVQSGSNVAPTQLGATIGTPAYMSPEQAEGRHDQLGPRSDVYSLGATLYYVLTGGRPFEQEDLGDLLHAVKNGRFESPRERNSSIPKSLSAICMKAMSLAPKDRYESPASLAKDIEAWLADEPVTAQPPTVPEKIARMVKRNRKTAIASAGFTVVTIAILLIAVVLIERARREERRERELKNVANANLTATNEELGIANSKLSKTVDALDDANDELESSLARTQTAEEDARLSARVSDIRLYRSQLEQIQELVRDNEIPFAIETLHSCQHNLRGWEWSYLESILDSSQDRFPVSFSPLNVSFSQDGRSIFLATFDEGESPIRRSNFIEDISLETGQRVARQIFSQEEGDYSLASHLSKWIPEFLDLEHIDRISLGLYVEYDRWEKVQLLALPSRKSCVVVDSKSIKIWSDEGVAQLWPETDENTDQSSEPIHINDIAVSNDENQIAWCASNGDFCVYDLQLNRIVSSTEHSQSLTCLRFLTQEGRIATGNDRGQITIWDTDKESIVEQWTAHSGAVACLAIHPTIENVLASGGNDAMVFVWKYKSATNRAPMIGHLAPITDLAFSADGCQLLSSSTTGSVHLWNTEFVQDDAESYWDFSLRDLKIWSGEFYQRFGEIDVLDELIPSSVNATTVGVKTYKDDSSNFVLLDLGDGSIASSREFPSTSGFGESHAMSSDGSLFAYSASGNDTVSIYDVTSDRITHEFVKVGVTGLAFSRSGSMLAICGYREVSFWDVKEGGGLLWTFDLNTDPRIVVNADLSFSPDDRYLLCTNAEADTEVAATVIDLEKREAVCQLKPLPDTDSLSGSFSVAGGVFTVIERNWTGRSVLSIYDAETFAQHAVVCEESEVIAARIDEPQERLFILTRQGTLIVRDSQSFELICSLRPMNPSVQWATTPEPDGSTMLKSRSDWGGEYLGVFRPNEKSKGGQRYVFSNLVMSSTDSPLGGYASRSIHCLGESHFATSRHQSGLLKVVDITDGRQEISRSQPFLAVSKSGTMMAQSYAQGGVQVVDTLSGRSVARVKVSGEAVVGCQFSENSDTLAIWTESNLSLNLYLVEAKTGSVLTRIQKPFRVQNFETFNSNISLSIGSSYVSACYGLETKLYEIETGSLVWSMPADSSSECLIAGNDEFVVVSQYDGVSVVRVVDHEVVATANESTEGVSTFRDWYTHQNWLLPGRDRIAMATREGGIEIRTIKDLSLVGTALPKSERGTLAQVHDVSFSPDGKYLAAGYGDGAIRLFNVESLDELGCIYAHCFPCYDVDFSSDGEHIASSGYEEVCIWNLDSIVAGDYRRGN